MRLDWGVGVSHRGGRDKDSGARRELNNEFGVPEYQVPTTLVVVPSESSDRAPSEREVSGVNVI